MTTAANVNINTNFAYLMSKILKLSSTSYKYHADTALIAS